MNQNRQEQKNFLKYQLELTKEQIQVLDKMDIKLQEMKKIAEYAAANALSTDEIEKLNS